MSSIVTNFSKNSDTQSQVCSFSPHCQKCTRLQVYRKQVAQPGHWAKPVAGWGDPQAQLFIVGLAPSARGANRTGRMITGDASADFLYPTLFQFGFCNQPTSTQAQDGLRLLKCYITCVVKCVPPQNKPTSEETKNCLPYLRQEILAHPQVQVYLALGQFAFSHLWKELCQPSLSIPRPSFEHGKAIPFSQAGVGPKLLLLSYHPSPQNTLTGKLTRPLFEAVFEKARTFLSVSHHSS